ncbi:MAG: DUF4861 family protein [Chitinophagaceae bacterium]
MKKNITSFTVLLFFILSATYLSAQKNVQYIVIKSNTTKGCKNYIASIPWEKVVKKYPAIDTNNFKIISAVTKKEIVYQLEYLGNNVPQNLLLQVDLLPATAEKFFIVAKAHSNFESKTYCRYVPERKDDFAWENDKIGFRIYGKALEGTKENANGIDVWVKRTTKMVINDRYKSGDYHNDHGDGVDYYHVGLTLGAGNLVPFINDSFYFPKNYRTWKILDNGPLRTTFVLQYEDWNVNGAMVGMTKTISIDAGSQLSKIAINLSSKTIDSLPVVTGITMREGKGDHQFNQAKRIMAYWEPTDPKFGTTGVGCIFLQPIQTMKIAKEHLLTQFKIKTNKSFTYLSGAAWDRAKEITNAQAWYNYLEQYKQQLDIKVTAVVN